MGFVALKMKNYLFGILVFALAFGILSVSLVKGTASSFASSGILSQEVLGTQIPQIEYSLPYAGGVMPDSPLWPIKAARDRAWYIISLDPLKKSQLNLLFSDKRLVS